MWDYMEQLSHLLTNMATEPATELIFQFVHIGYTTDAKRPSLVGPLDIPQRPRYRTQISCVTDENCDLKPGKYHTYYLVYSDKSDCRI